MKTNRNFFKTRLHGWLILLAVMLTTTVAQAQSGIWTNRCDVSGNSDDAAYAMAVDGSGNVYVTGGSSTFASSSEDYVIIKYSSAGVAVWTNRYNGPGNDYDQATAMAVDGSGNVYVTGYSAGSGSGYDYATIKYSSAGVAVWTNRYNGPVNDSDIATAMAVDGSGNIYVTGYSYGSGSFADYATIKYSSAGVAVWTNRYNGPGNDSDIATAMAVDGSGNIYVTGYSYGSVSGSDYATIKYSSVGVAVWTNRYNGPGNDYDLATAMAVDGGGNVYVTGYSVGSGSSDDYATIKYSSAGVAVWTNRYNGPGNDSDLAHAMAVDGSGNVYVTGYSTGGGSGYDYATIQYSSAGVAVWTNRYNGPGNDSDIATAMAVDGSGNVYVTGYSVGSGSGYDYATIKYSSAGVVVWTNRYNGPGNGSDIAYAMAVDGSGNIYVTGISYGGSSGNDYATIKYGVPLAPLITTQPTNQTVVLTSNATFSVTASGPAPLAYQWYFNSGVISGGTNSSLTVSNTSLASAGNYQVIITNIAGSVTSSVATLTVLLPATGGIVFQDNFDPSTASSLGNYFGGDATNVSVGVVAGAGVGSSAALQIQSSFNNGPNGYGYHAGQWQSASVYPGNTDTNMNHYVLSFDALVTGDAAHQSGGGIALGIQEGAGQNFAPPFPQGVLQTFQAFQGGSDLLLPQSGVWKHFDINLGGTTFQGLNGTNQNFNPTGQTWQVTFQINAGTWGNEPQTNSTLLIDNLALATGIAPSITQQPVTQMQMNGSNLNFSVTAYGSAPFTYQWLFNGAAIAGATNSALTVSNTTLANAGNYQVVVSNPFGAQASDSVDTTPYFVNWFKVAGGGGTSTGGVFTVTDTFGQHDAGGPMQGGGFSVMGGFWSPLAVQSASLTGTAPAITAQSQSQFVIAGNSAALSVSVSGTPPFFCQWQKNGVNLADGGNVSGSTTTNLTLSTTSTNDGGSYTVIIENAYGSVTSSVVKLTVLSAISSTKVAVLGADYSSYVADVVSKISGVGYFSQVDTIFVGGPSATTTPTLAQLQQYSAVLVFSDYPFSDPATLGNNLASYVNGGGGVVVCLASFISGYSLDGSFASGYLPFTIAGYDFGTPLSLVADQPSHSILAGVTSFNGGTSSYYSPIAIANGASLVAHWNNGYPLVATKIVGTGHIVGLNFFPASSDARSDLWTASTGGAKLMANSLAWAAGTPFPPKFQTASRTGNTFNLSWNAVNAFPPLGYQVQSTTNLAPANWINLGGVLTGTGPTISTTDLISTNSQRFYRVLLVQ